MQHHCLRNIGYRQFDHVEVQFENILNSEHPPECVPGEELPNFCHNKSACFHFSVLRLQRPCARSNGEGALALQWCCVCGRPQARQ